MPIVAQPKLNLKMIFLREAQEQLLKENHPFL